MTNDQSRLRRDDACGGHAGYPSRVLRASGTGPQLHRGGIRDATLSQPIIRMAAMVQSAQASQVKGSAVLICVVPETFR